MELKSSVYRMLKLSCFCILICIKCAISTFCDINADTLVFTNTKLDGFQFWSASTADIGSCAKTCLRVKLCVSINYGLYTRVCDLNSDSLTNQPQALKTVTGVVYSNIATWPSTLDPDCFGRPCGDDEVCVPGKLGGGGPIAGCSYSCLKFKSTAQAADQTTTTTAPTVTSTSTSTVTSTLTSTTTTTQEVTTTSTSTTTQAITSTSTTTPTSTSTSTTSTTPTSTSTSTTPSTTSTTTPTTTSTSTTTPTTTTTPTSTSTTTSTTTPTSTSTSTTTSTTTTSTSTSTTTTTTPTTTTTTPAPTPAAVEGNIRLVGGQDSSQGRLEIYHNSVWRQVSDKDWRWKMTKTACRQMGYNYGGSYHKHEAYGQGTGTSVKLKDIDCDGDEAKLTDCGITDYESENNHDKDLGLTCYTENRESGFMRLRSQAGLTHSSVKSGIAEVKYNNTWGSICGFHWSDSDLFCSLLDSDWVKDDECKESCAIQGNGPIWMSDVHCDDDPPHIFYCKHTGWGIPKAGECTHNEDVNIECKDD